MSIKDLMAEKEAIELLYKALCVNTGLSIAETERITEICIQNLKKSGIIRKSAEDIVKELIKDGDLIFSGNTDKTFITKLHFNAVKEYIKILEERAKKAIEEYKKEVKG